MKKVVIVTGSNRGIGYSLLKLLGNKYDLVMTYRNEKNGKEAEEKLKKEGVKLRARLKLDLSSTKSIDNFVKEVENNFKVVDFLVNNSGLAKRKNKNDRKEDLSVKNAKEIFEVNTWGTIYLTEKLVSITKSILFTSSRAGQVSGYFKDLDPELKKKYESNHSDQR